MEIQKLINDMTHEQYEELKQNLFDFNNWKKIHTQCYETIDKVDGIVSSLSSLSYILPKNIKEYIAKWEEFKSQIPDRKKSTVYMIDTYNSIEKYNSLPFKNT